MNISQVTSKVEWTPGAQEKLNQMPDEVVYTIARMTLDTSLTHIPLSNNTNAGKLRQSSMSAGVKGSDKNYYVGSYTDYAKYVWNMENVNWSTSGTYGKWYETIFKKQSNNFIQSALERNKL